MALVGSVRKVILSVGKIVLNEVERVSALTGFTSALYYLFFSSNFRCEQKAVLRGKIAYRNSLSKPGESSYLLRRNIHRIEKGLIMEPRKPNFALSYIAETVRILSIISKGSKPDMQELKWAFGVLDEYFRVVSVEEPSFRSTLENYRSLRHTVEDVSGPKPFPATELCVKAVHPEQFAELCRIRRSVRWYEKRLVAHEIIDRAVQLAGSAPSACNRQPFQYLIYDDPVFIHKVASVPMGVTGFSENFPTLAVLVGNLGAYFNERDRHLIYIDGALSAMTFMFALQTEGVSSCSINWPDVIKMEKEIRNIIPLPENQRIILLISFGYARGNGLVPSSIKKSVDQLRIYNYQK